MRPALNTFVSFPIGLLWHAFGGAQMQGMHPSLYPTEQSRHSGLKGTQDFHSGSGGLQMQISSMLELGTFFILFFCKTVHERALSIFII